MLKYLAGLVLVFGLTVYVSIQDERSPQQTTQKPAYADKGTLPTKADENHSQQNVPYPKWNAPRWYLVLSPLFRWPEGPTTWVIVLTLLAIAEQSRESAKATQAVRDSLPLQKSAADAALLNAQAVINAERPWIVVTARRSKDQEEFTVWGDVQGRTPAKIVSGWGDFVTVPNTESQGVDNLPDEPVYKKDGTTVLPYEMLAVQGQFPFSIYVLNIATRIKPQIELWKRIDTFEEVLFMFGKLVYTDILTKDAGGEPIEHETRWCFQYIPSKPEGMVTKGGKPTYNRYS